MTKPVTNLTVRVQARGGMFLGPDSYGGAIITVKDFSTKEEIANGFTDKGGSGSRSLAYTYQAAPSSIITPTKPVPTIYWLIASPGTVQYAVALSLLKPTLLEISARVPLPVEQGDQFVSVTQWMVPGRDITVGAGFVLEIPGLWVQPEVISNGKELRIRAKVTMMCGCEINDNSPWIPEDFVVSATVKSAPNSKLSFDKAIALDFEENSQFTGQLSVPEAGGYVVEISGYQFSTANTGFAKKAIEV